MGIREQRHSHVVRQGIEQRLSRQEGAERLGIGVRQSSNNAFGLGDRTAQRAWYRTSGAVHRTTVWKKSVRPGF